MARRARPASWGPGALPDMRRGAVERFRLVNLDPESALGRLPARDHAMTAEWREGIAAQMEAAELFWVTRDMTRAALDASRDMPPWVPAALAPGPYGILIWDADLPDLPDSLTSHLMRTVTTGARGVRPLGGILWGIYGGSLHLRALSTTMGGRTTLAPDILTWSLPAAEPVPDRADGVDGAQLAVSYLLAATWSLMMTPTVATAIPSAPDGRDARLRARAGQPPARVTTIDLRPLRTVSPEDTGEGEGRAYRHRWVVRGHWRNQAHGPGRVDRRIVWVPSYIKGPEGAPLLSREHVYVWRR